MALRFFLGMFEAGFGPGLPFYLSYFYLRHEIGLRIGIITTAGPLSTCFAGALAYGITSGHSNFANWRLLFLVEGLPTILIAGVVWFFFPDSPEKARFLNEDDKATARARGVRQVGHESDRVGRIVWSDIGAALLDAKVSYLHCPSFELPFIRIVGLTNVELHHSNDVLLLQRFFLITASLPPHHNQWDGLHGHQRTRTLSTTILHLLHRRPRHHSHSRPDWPKRYHNLHPLPHRSNRLHSPRRHLRSLHSLSGGLFRYHWYLSRHYQHSALGCE